MDSPISEHRESPCLYDTVMSPQEAPEVEVTTEAVSSPENDHEPLNSVQYLPISASAITSRVQYSPGSAPDLHTVSSPITEAAPVTDDMANRGILTDLIVVSRERQQRLYSTAPATNSNPFSYVFNSTTGHVRTPYLLTYGHTSDNAPATAPVLGYTQDIIPVTDCISNQDIPVSATPPRHMGEGTPSEIRVESLPSDLDRLIKKSVIEQDFSHLIKDSLKFKIQHKRQETGQAPLEVKFEEPRQYELTEEEKIKIEKRKERNRVSARRSRKRRRSEEDKLLETLKELESDNKKLKKEVKMFASFEAKLREKFSSHIIKCLAKGRQMNKTVNNGVMCAQYMELNRTISSESGGFTPQTESPTVTPDSGAMMRNNLKHFKRIRNFNGNGNSLVMSGDTG